MAKQYTVIVTSTEAQDLRTHKVAQNSGDKGKALRIKAKAGETYQLVEVQPGQAQSYAPQQVKVKRVGKDLVITFEGGSRPDIIIEGYYDVMAKDHKGLIGLAEDGNFYEYIPEDPHPLGMVQLLPEGGQDVAMALGAGEIIAPAAAAIAAFPLLGALGLLGGAAAAAYVINKDDPAANNGISGKLSNQSDNIDGGNVTDNRTRDNTPTLTGTVPVGSTAVVTVNGVDYPATVNPDGTWTASIDKTNLPDGTYYPILKVTQNGVTTPHNITPFTIDTTPPSIAITSNAAALASGETATITFTLSEAVADFAEGDVTVTGGKLSNFQRDPSNPLKYTATVTPNSTGTSATIQVDNTKFSDAVANFNTDGAEANNTVTLTTNATVTGALDQTATNANGTPNDSGAKGDNITNDNTPTLKGKVPQGSTAKVLINGVEYPVTVNPDGTWSFTNPTNLPDGTYTPQLIVTPPGSTTPNAPVPLTPFTIDTVPPSIAITAPTNSLVAGQTTPITFTLSEPVADFALTDIAVTGGTLSNLVQSATDPKVYTATFTPASTGTSATIRVDSGKFSDAAANFNTDGAETNNTVTLATNAAVSGGLAPVSDNSTGTPNDNTTNDPTPELSGKAAPGSSVKIKIKDKDGNVVGEGTATVDPNGNWTYTQPSNLPDGTYSPEVIVNGGTPVPLKPFVIDTLPPTVIVTAPVSSLAAGASTTVTFTLTEAATNLTDADFVVTGGTLGTLMHVGVNSSGQDVYTATFTSTNGGAGAVSIANNAFSDAAGNLNKDTYVNPASTGATYESNNTWAFNTGNPTPTPGDSKSTALTIDRITGDNILTATEQGTATITVTGKVTGKFVAGDIVTLTVGGVSRNVAVAADGTYQLPIETAKFVADSDLKIEGTVTGTGGSAATAAQQYTKETSDVITKTALSIDPVTADNIIGSAESAGNIPVTGKVTGKFSNGDIVTLTVNGKTFTGPAAADGTFSINVPAADLLADTNTTVDGTVSGTGGTTATAMQDYGVDPNINPVPGPSVKTALTINAITGDNLINSTEQGATSTIVTGKVTGTFAANDTVTLLVNGKTYTGPAAADGSYSISVPTADLVADADSKIEGSVTGTGGQLATAAQDYALDANAPTAPTKTALTIDPIAADNMISNDENTGSINVTGTVTGKFAAGDKVTITVNGKPFTGVADANGKFTIPVPATDLTADSDTQVDGTVTGTGGTVATALQNYGVNTTSPSPVPPASLKTALTIDPVTGDNVMSTTDTAQGNTVVTGKVTGAFAAGDTVTLTLNGQTFSGTVTSLGNYSISIPTSHFTADSDTKIEGTVTGTGGSLATAAQDYVVETSNTPTQTALSIDKVTADNIISSTETNGNINITGKVTGKFAPNDTVTLTVNGKTYTGQAAADGSFSIPVPASDLVADADTTVDGTVNGTGGTTAAAMQNYGVDSAVPAPSLKTALTINPITGDNLLNSAEQNTSTNPTTTVTGKVTGTFVAGDIVTLVINGHNYTAPVAADGTYSISNVATSDLVADADKKIEGSVTGSNGGQYATAAQNYALDANAPANPTQTALTIDPVTADNIIGSTESTGNINVTGKVTGKFSAGDVVTLTINGKTFNATAAADGTYSVAVPASDLLADIDTTITGAVHGTGGTDAAAMQNYGVDANVNPVQPGDTTPPTIIVERTNPGLSSLDANSTETITFTLSEASTTFDGSDIVVTGGTLSGFTPVAGSGTAATGYTKYTAVFTPAANSSGTATVGVASGKFADNAGNNNQDTYVNPAPNGATYESNNQVSLAFNTTSANPVDTDKPTIQITIDKASLATGQSATLTFILSEASTDFTLADIDVFGGNGTVSNLQVVPGSNGAQYTATYTAGNSAGTDRIGVLSGKFSDAAGNQNADTYLGSATGTAPSGATGEANNWVSLTNTGANDTTAPTVAVSRMGSGTVGSAGETIVFTLSEASTDFTSADVTVSGGTLTNWTPVAGSNGTQYTATFVPTSGANGTATIGVLSNKFSDAAANFNKDTYTNPATGTDVYEANNQITLGYDTRTNPAPADTTAPTIAITASATTLNAGQTATVTFVLSEASTDFTAADVAVTGGTLSNFQVVAGSGNTEYTATFTPTAGAQGTGSVHVDSNAFRDAANNYNTDGAEANNTVNFITNNGALPADTTPPTIAITSNQAALTAGQTATITFTLSEASTDFVVGDVEVSGGTLSNFTGSGTTYTATFTPATNSTTNGVIKVASGKFSDASSNLNKDTYTNPATGTDVYEANNIVTLTVNTNASLALVNDTAAAVEAGVVNGNNAVTGTNPSGNVLTNDTGTTGSTAVTAIAAGSTTGTVGSALAGQFGSLTLNADGSYVYTVNNSNATVNALPAGSTLTDVFTYSVGGQTANLTVTITGTNDAPVYVANSLVNQTVDIGSALSYQFATTAFTDVDTGDTATYSATLADGSALPSWLTFNAATRTFTGTPPAGTAPGTISVKVIDTDSGLATANGLFNIVINAAGDTTPPTILVERANPASSLDAVGTETIIFTLSEASTTFDGSDIAVTGGTLSNFTPVASSGTAATGYTKYTAVFTPAANSNGTATIGVASGKFTDNAGNANQDTYLTPAPTGAVTELAANNTNLVSVVYDTRSTNPADNDKPTIQVSVDKTSIANGQTATLTFILSEASADFTLADIDVISGGGTVTNLLPVAGSNGVQYTATYTAGSTAGNVLIGVDAGKFADAAGNINNDTYKGNATGTTAVGGTAAEANNWVQLTNTGASDTTAPTVVVTRMGSGTVGSAGETVVFTLSEASSDFVVGDVTVTGGTLTNFTAVPGSNGTQYSATFVPTTGTNGTATIGVLSGKFSDAASNLNKDTYTNPATGTDVYEANNQIVLDYDARTSPAPADTTAPTIAISASATTLAANATATVTFTLSEASTDFNQADVVVTGGTLSNWTQVNATEYTATFTPTAGAQGTGSVHVDSNKFSDAALNYNTDGADANNTVNFITNNGVLPADTTPPTIAITSNQASLSSGQTATITFTLSEASTDFVVGDVEVSGGTLSNFTGSGTTYTATFTPTANSQVNGEIKVASGKFSDAATNLNKDTYVNPATGTDVYEANNKVTLTVNTTIASSLTLINDTATAVESGVTSGNTAVTGTNPSGNVLTNDTAATSVTGIAAGSTTGSVGTALQGLYGTLTLQSNGSYVYTLNNSNATVNALQVGSSLTDVFTYTATDGTTSKTANLSVTINGTDDAPTVAVALVDQAGTIGTALGYTFDSGTFADVDTADTKTYTATLADGSPLPSWLTFNASTRTFSGTPPGAGTTSVKVTCTDSQGATANDIFDIVVTAPVVSSVKTALTINPVTGDNVILNSENTGSITLTGKVSGTFAAGDTVTLVINGTNYTATAAADGSYSVAVLASDLAADSDKKVEGAVVGTGGELATAAQTYVLESTDTPTKTALAIDPITADNVVIANEANGSGNVSVTGKVTGVFAAGDTVTLTINGHTYTATAAANGTFSVDVLYSDLTADADTTVDGTVTGTGGTTATAVQNYALVDEAPPTIAVARSGSGTMTAAETITFTLSEASSTFAFADVDVTGGTLDSASWTAVSSTVYTAIFTPTSNTVGTASVGVKAGTFSDAAGNLNQDTYEPFISGTTMEADNIVNMNVNTDVTPPTIAISQITSPVTGATTVTFTLSEDSSDFTAADVFVTAGAGSLSNWTAVSGTVYTATFTPTANSSGSVTIGVAAGKFADAAGLSNKDTYDASADSVSGHVVESNNKTDFTYNTDVTAPTVAITGPSGAVNGPVTITFTLSEASSDFALSAGDITVSGGGTLSNFQQSASNPLVYTATYTPPATSSGSATIDIASGKFSDTAGNFNADGGDVNNHLPLSYDTVTPTVEVTRATNHTLGGTGAPYTTETITFTLSEASSDFTSSSVTVAGGALSGWTAVSSTVYTAIFTPTSGSAGIGTIGVAAGKFHDLAGNANADTYLPGTGNEVNNQVSVDYDTQAPTQTVSFGSMTKDSSLATAASGDGTTVNWTTADSSAGRLVSGFLSAPLAAGETVKVYSVVGGVTTLIGDAVVNSAGTAWEITDTTGYSANWTYTAKVVDIAGNPGTEATRAVTLTTMAATAQDGTDSAATVAYSGTTLNAMGGDDIITIASTTLQTDLGSTGFIDGGAGIDTLQLAAATTLNLEALTTNQTVKNIQEVEIFKMQGSSTLQMSANDVLSLGGANASTMAPFTFASTRQVNDGSTTPTGSTSSEGKVQMVVQGTNSDTLKLDTLASDGTTNAGVSGNAGLSGVWEYKGTVQVGLTTYKVYDHSTTNAQVLVDVPVVVNSITPIEITAITNDTYSSGNLFPGGNDFVTSDNTLEYSGTVPVEFVDASHDVFVEILNSSGVVVRSGTATVTGTSWTWSDTGYNLADGNYTIRSTIVDQGTTTATTAFGAMGVDTQPLKIDTTLPTIVVTRATSNTLSAGQTETITFTLSEAATDFTSADVTVTNGEIINFSGSGTSYTATFVPASGSGTGTIKVDSTKFSDLAGNFNADGADTAAGVTNIVSVAYQALPTQTATFSSMTKDSGLATSSTNNHDWLTNDGSAGRLVSGTLDAPLTAGQTLKVYANGVLIGDAVVNGQAWEITDLTGYTAGWIYTAKVVDSANNAGPVATQVVNTDFTEGAPVITSVTDSANASISNNGTTTNALSTVSGTGNAGDTIYLYDNTGTNLVGTTTVASNGTWSISGLASNAGVGAGSNTFSARQADALGNTSVLSNLWTVNAGGANLASNGDFSSGNTGFTSDVTYHAGGATNFTGTYWLDGTRYSVTSQYEGYDANLETPLAAGATVGTGASAIRWATDYGTTTVTATLPNPDNAFTGNMLYGNIGSSTVSGNTEMMVWSQSVNVVAGKTYAFKFDYWNDYARLNASIGGQKFQFTTMDTTSTSEAGHFTATFVAQTTGALDFKLYATAYTYTGAEGNFAYDNIMVAEAPPIADNSLVAGGTLPFTAGVDGASTALTYTGGAADMLAGDDMLNIGTNAQTLLGTAGNVINGSAGVDTLKLATGTVLNLETLTTNQTVKPIEQVEVFTMQGSSALTLSANDVLSLGGANASTMSAYNFSTTTGGTASTGSTGKVQMVIHGTSSDTLVLDPLKLDNVTTNSIVGNTGLAGQWDYMGTTTANGATYKVYNQSTTGAQVLVDFAVNVVIDDPVSVTNVATFSSMTKDSSMATANADWLTNDASAGRLVSGTLASPLAAGDVVKVYANGALIGNATVNAAGTAWEITDLNGYNANWTYTAQVVNSAGKGGTATVQQVNLGNTEAAPVITAVTDSTSTNIANNGTTNTTLSTVSGTGNAGDTIYLYDNTGTNLVGTTTVASDGTWSISGLATNSHISSGSNTFSARQVDALGNESVLSNTWTVTAAATNLFNNGDFSGGNTGFSTTGVYTPTGTSALTGGIYDNATPDYNVGTSYLSYDQVVATTTTVGGTVSGITWSTKYVTGAALTNPDGTMTGNVMYGGLVTTTAHQVIWSESVNVVAGQTYTFKFDYWDVGAHLEASIGGVVIPFYQTTTTHEGGHFTATFTAGSTGPIALAVQGSGNGNGGATGNYALDNFTLSPTYPADNSLTAGGTPPFTSVVDGVSTPMTYTGGAADMLAGDDMLNIGTNAQTLLGTAGNVINGSAGVDTLKLATGTVLNLETLTTNQTVKPIEQVEVFTMQGSSALTLSANDVLSLGGANASTMSAYNFSTTTGGTASTGSTGKVQMVIHGTSSDTLVLDPLKLDNVTTNGIVGNTGLTGQWDYMGITTANGGTYKVYNQSTTGAQVLVDFAVNVVIDDPVSVTNVATFSSMTKDSSMATANADWLTNDASAGRLVSGTLASPLAAGDVVKVYANGALIGNATVNAAGTAWEITDLTGYTGNWTYTAQVVNSAGKGGTATVQQVSLDNTEAAPTILAVTDSDNATIGNNGSTYYALSTVSGTGNAGDTIYLYDNTGTNLVGTTTVANDGTWSISGLANNAALGSGSNAFSARQVDALGNLSGLSNVWTVNTSTSGNLLDNGDLHLGNTGFTATEAYVSGLTPSQFYASSGASYTLFSTSDTQNNVALSSTLNYGTSAGNGSGAMTYQINYGATNGDQISNPGGYFSGQYFGFNSQSTAYGTFWADTINVVAGQTYNFSLDYINWNHNVRLYVGNSYVDLWGNVAGNNSTGTSSVLYAHGWGTFTAATTGTLSVEFRNINGMVDFQFDNLYIGQAVTPSNGSLVAGTTPPFTSGVDGTSTAITYTGGAADMLAGDDVLNIGTNAQTLLATAGNVINGSAGVDTLKLATGTVLNLETLTTNQTVKPIEQVEVFTMQGSSALTLSANDVLSLGGANASTMSAYAFASTTGGSGTTSSTGKVQMVVNGTASDVLDLTMLNLDGVTTNGVVGNTGLAGAWSFMGTTTIGSTTYKVYNHSTTQAQVLVNPNVTVNLENPIAFTSMTKDSGTLNADWTTADGSAGRLVSGVLGVPLLAGQTVEVYSGTTLIGTAQVAANGTSWAITDTTAYNANWSYTAKIMSGGSAVSTATQAVTLDNSEAAPVISAVVDSASATIANNGTSTNSLTTVSGTGLAGDVLYLYDNSSNNLVGTTVVGSNGTWSISGLQIPAGSNTFAARQVDAAGNQSVLSNLYVVNSAATNLISNGDLSQGNTGFTSTITNVLTSAQRMATTNNYAVESIASGQPANIATATTPTLTSPANYAYGTWTKDYITGTTWGNPDGSMAGNVLTGNLATATPQTVWATSVNVVAGKTYTFTFDYALNAVNGPNMILWLDNQGIEFQEAGYESGHFTATYTATETKSINLSLRAGNSTDGASGGDFWLDNFVFRPSAVASDNTLTAAGTPPATPGNDGVSTPLNYASGILDALAGNDLITANSSLVANLAAGGRIMGGAGVDTLKLAANTSLNLEAFTRNQTVTPIQEVEIFQLQGGSTLTLSANDVLSLGGANLSGYSFAGSAGKVQLVVNATNTDTVNLTTLSNDGVTVNGSVGNTGLDGSWSYAGITSIGGSSYKVYNHSTTQAQVLVLNASVNVPSYTQAVTIDFAQADTKSRVEDFNVLTSGTVDTASTTGAIETDSWSVAGYWGPSTGASAGTLMASSVGVFVGTTGVAGVDAGLGTDNYLRIGNSGWTATTRALDTVFTSKTGEFNSIAFKMGDLNYQSSTPAVVTFYDAANNVVATVNWYVGNTYDTFSYDLGSKTATKFKVSTTTGDAWFMDELTTTLNSSNALASGASIMDATPRLTGSFSDPLGVGDVIKIYEGSRYLGEATVDAVTKTWYFQLPSMEIGSHTYNAVINSGSGALPVNSGNFTLNLLATPLVLDLDGDGIETTTLAAGVVFDLDANGTAERAAWVAGGDGLLVRDLDGNGLITSGAELFGSGTTLANGAKALDGFAALAGLDSNGDGIINASDAAFGQLQVWVDANGDAQTDAGELRSLADLGIASLGLQSQASDLQNNGNAVGLLGNYTTTDGAAHVLADVWLQNQALPVLDLTQVLSDAQTATANLSNGQAELLRLNVSDVLAVQANANGQHVVQITGDSQDVVDLSDLFADGHTTGTWGQNGTVQQGGQTFNVYSYSGDASLQVLIDQHLQHVTLS